VCLVDQVGLDVGSIEIEYDRLLYLRL